MTGSKNILISCCGGELVPFVLRDLRKTSPHLNIVGVDMNDQPVARGLCDAFYTVPRGSDPAYLRAILDSVERHKIDLVIPWSDDEVLTLVRHKASLEERSCALAAPDEASLSFASNKEITYRTLRDHKIGVPDFDVVYRPEELRPVIEGFIDRWPEFVLKPSVSRGGRDVFVVDSRAKDSFVTLHNRQTYCDLNTFYRVYAPELSYASSYLVMEKLSAPAYDVDVLSWQGMIHRIVPRRRHNPDGLPYTGYTLEQNLQIEALVDAAARQINLSHLYDIDVMMGQDGTPRVMEINPRPSGSIAYAHHAGIPLMADLIACHFGGEMNAEYSVPEISINPSFSVP